ncbi:MAG TPA: polyprenyl synthetase family protein, partial [Arachnia sp.]|nr:polyprenyl synthetase family protein [Arachnia sp.]
YGDPAVTGKPYGGDIHEGKRTVLVLTALASADPGDAAELDALLGSPGLTDADVARAAALIEASGARARVEQLIDDRTDEALAILDAAEMTEEGRAALARLAEMSVRRAS